MYFNTHHLSQMNKVGNPLVADRNVLNIFRIIEINLMVEIFFEYCQAHKILISD